MKVALLLTGLPRKVQEGYDKCWKHIIENYDTDVYLHFWEDEKYEKVLEVYNPKKYICQKPFKFTEYKKNTKCLNDNNRVYFEKYDVFGNEKTLPMMYGWQSGYNLIDTDYDCIIRSRYDLKTSFPFKLENIDFTKINISANHWPGSPIIDDNLSISNQLFSNQLFSNIFYEFTEHIQNTGFIYFPEKNFTEMLEVKNLYKYTCKTQELKFKLLR
jgi:hypothetical protein